LPGREVGSDDALLRVGEEALQVSVVGKGTVSVERDSRAARPSDAFGDTESTESAEDDSADSV